MRTSHRSKSKQVRSRSLLQCRYWLSWSFADWSWCQQCHLSHICLCTTMSKCVCVRRRKGTLLALDVHPGGQVGKKRQCEPSTEAVTVYNEGSQHGGSMLTGSKIVVCFFLKDDAQNFEIKRSLKTNIKWRRDFQTGRLIQFVIKINKLKLCL